MNEINVPVLHLYNRYVELLLARNNNFLAILSEEFGFSKHEVKKILSNKRAIQYFEPHLEHLLRTTSIDKIKLLEEVRAIAFSNISDILDAKLEVKNTEDIPKHALSAVQSIEKKIDKSGEPIYTIKFWNKMEAINLLAKMADMFVDKLQLEGEVKIVHRLFDDVTLKETQNINNSIIGISVN